MPLRTRTAWSSLRDDQIYPLLRETSAGYWSATLLLSLANHSLDQRALELGEAHEGWISQAYLADTVAGQREYALPEGTERVRGVYLRYTTGNSVEELQLARNDRIGQDYYSTDVNASYRQGGVRPEYRAMDNLILIEPPTSETLTGGLRLELDALPPKLTGDASVLSLLWPMSTETLLVYDTVLLALGVEDSQGNQDDNTQAHSQIKAFHRRLESSWREMIAVRNQSRVYGTPYWLGD
jgi:hypothetical protein